MTSVITDTTKTRRGAVSLRKLTKDYAGSRAVDGIDLDIPAGEFFTLLGPSGCGKTTTLMMLAGFVEPSGGSVVIDGRDVAHVPPPDRDIGVVFQNYALFPHLTVFQNLAFPLEMRRLGRPEIARRVGEALKLVRLEQWADSYPGQLSGGQQQRVAVARAVVFNPPVLLMDEPLGALDRKLRLQLQLEIRSLQRELALTVVYVTHDQDEAMSMSDRVAIMREGRIEQMGTPAELYETPVSVFVADFLGDNNTIPARAADDRHVMVGDVALRTPAHGLARDADCVVLIRPERVRISDAPATFSGVVHDVVYLGSASQYEIDVAGAGRLRCAVSHNGGHAVWEPGRRVGVELPADSVHVMPGDPTSKKE
ncbi:ABC transporter ATP-binding protein [Saccharopolyspora phatthalungensis]|uniref:Spermidine/putrescine ABC transporter ATP-binding subunit n=1 Tax=Saccharopolyspora phatthalungensis TaxID=664693 RepID=A0A840QHC8_9PSEU|nr:ABC transporter ATP-binding protein [Saccharopolyspora phatthalungensis]MBB5159390.1 spermidine/putrescine ABC transporter ATP-binding subunit [Saccharopolyspora phatthalungensis]